MRSPSELALTKDYGEQTGYILNRLEKGVLTYETAIQYARELAQIARSEIPVEESWGMTEGGEYYGPGEPYNIKDAAISLANSLDDFVDELIAMASKTKEPTSDTKPLQVSGIMPVKWKWKPADLGWLFEALTRKGAIDCGPSAFAALFAQIDGRPMPADLSNAYKGQGPKKQGTKDMMDAISRYSPDSSEVDWK